MKPGLYQTRGEMLRKAGMVAFSGLLFWLTLFWCARLLLEWCQCSGGLF